MTHPQALALSSNLERGHAMLAWLDGKEIALWRDHAGAAHALDNQCPHRGMRLSHGKVTAHNRLACPYHGWEFNADGRCMHIPATPELAPVARDWLRPLPVCEHAGLVFVAGGDSYDGTVERILGSARAVRSVFIDAGSAAVRDALERLADAAGMPTVEGHPYSLRPVAWLAPGIASLCIETSGAEYQLMVCLQDAGASRSGTHWLIVPPPVVAAGGYAVMGGGLDEGMLTLLACRIAVWLRDTVEIATSRPVLHGNPAMAAALPSPPQIDQATLDQWYALGCIHDLRARSVRTRLLGRPMRAGYLRDAQHPQAFFEDDQSRALPCIERYGYVWCCPGEPPAAMEIAEFDDPRRRLVTCPPVSVFTSGQRIVENFLDMAHFPFVHPGILGEASSAAVRDHRASIDWERGEVMAAGCRFDQPRRHRAEDGAQAGALQPIDYLYRTYGPFNTVLWKKPAAQEDWLLIGLFLQPVEAEHCIVHSFLLTLDRTTPEPAMREYQLVVFMQDVPVVESQRPRALPVGPAQEIAGRADRASLAYRQWLQRRGIAYGVTP